MKISVPCATTVALNESSGATATMDGENTGSTRASESPSVRLDVPVAVIKGRTNNRSDPNASMVSVTVSAAPRPTDIVEITAATPITIPRSVRVVRSRFPPIDDQAVRISDVRIIVHPLKILSSPALGWCWVHRSPPCRLAS